MLVTYSGTILAQWALYIEFAFCSKILPSLTSAQISSLPTKGLLSDTQYEEIKETASFSFPTSVRSVIPWRCLTFLCPCHSLGSTFIWAPPQLELHVGTSPETWYFTPDLQHPRPPCWCCSILPSAQQCWNCPSWHQHLQPFCRFWFPHGGLFLFHNCTFNLVSSVFLGIWNRMLVYAVIFLLCFSILLPSMYHETDIKWFIYSPMHFIFFISDFCFCCLPNRTQSNTL